VTISAEHQPRLTVEDVYFSYEFQAWNFEDEEDEGSFEEDDRFGPTRSYVAHELFLDLQAHRAESPPTEHRVRAPYLRTPEWRERAERAKQVAGNRCRLCNDAGPLREYLYAR
jgi:hypothetical protein